MKQGISLRSMAAASDEAVIDIVGIIGWSVAYQELRDILRSIPEGVKRVVFDIYSPGGDVWEGNGIVQEIGELGKRVDTVARVQVAASMATLIAVACKERTIASNGRWLIHNAWTQTTGDAATHEKQAKTLRDAEQEAARFYAERTGGKAEDMLAIMAEERWMMPEETLKLGFVSAVSDPFKSEKYDAVKQEIVAAGKWPQALVELPKVEEVKDVHIADKGAVVPAPVVEVVADKSADVAPVVSEPPVVEEIAAVSPEYQRGFDDGTAAGKVAALLSLDSEVAKLKQALEQAQAEARKNQSEKDRLAAALKAEQKASDERAKLLQASIDEATARLRQFVSGSLTFQASVETWSEAMSACGGNYEEARKKYSQVFEKYLADERQKGK